MYKKKGNVSIMDKVEIYEMVIREMTEHAILKRRENLDEQEQELYSSVKELSKHACGIVKELPESHQEILEEYFEKTNLIADHEIAYLYRQGAKDCVELLKKMGVL